MDNSQFNQLLALLLNNKFREFSQVIKPLIQSGEPQLVDFLINLLLQEDLSAPAKQEIIEALGKPGNSKALEPLLGFLDNQNIFLKGSAIQSLGQIGDVRAIVPLVQLLKAKDDTIKNIVEYALISIGQAATPEVVKALKGKHFPERMFGRHYFRSIKR